jgi:hypothetical protein
VAAPFAPLPSAGTNGGALALVQVDVVAGTGDHNVPRVDSPRTCHQQRDDAVHRKHVALSRLGELGPNGGGGYAAVAGQHLEYRQPLAWSVRWGRHSRTSRSLGSSLVVTLWKTRGAARSGLVAAVVTRSLALSYCPTAPASSLRAHTRIRPH